MQLMLNNKEKDILLHALEYCLTNPTKTGTKDFEEKERKSFLSLFKKIEKSQGKIKVRSAKNKGLEFQKKIAQVISELIGIEASQDDDSLIMSRLSSQNGTDIILRGKAQELFPYSCECKNCSSVSLPAWVAQAKQNSTEQYPWMLFIHSKLLDDNDIAVMNLKTFEEIYSGKMKGLKNAD